jgi:precorrin-2 dehydrogenase/sirohydrochlorin ferrochelatase
MNNRNNLYPVFLKLSNLNVLIVGGGYVAEEKLRFLLKSSPDANVEMVATFYREGTIEAAHGYNVIRNERPFEPDDLNSRHIVIAATDNLELNRSIYIQARDRQLLVNVADNPDLCDFYLGGIVTKGNLKIAISTNGKSPTVAKRLRELFEEILPEEIDDVLNALYEYRKTLKGDFEFKIQRMNELTEVLGSRKGDL